MTPKQITADQMKAARQMNKTYSDMLFISQDDLRQLLLDTAEQAFKAGQESKQPKPAADQNAVVLKDEAKRPVKRPTRAHLPSCRCAVCEDTW